MCASIRKKRKDRIDENAANAASSGEKVPLNLYIDKRLKEEAKKRIPNLSRTVESVLRMLLYGDASIEIVRIGKRGDATGMPERPAAWQAAVSSRSSNAQLQSESVSERSTNISEPAIGQKEKAMPSFEKSLNWYWNTYGNQFLEFLKVGAPPKIKPVSEGTRKDYRNALTKFFDKYTINNWQELRKALIERNMPKPLVNGLGKFLTFLTYHEYMSEDEANRWRKGIIRKESKPKTVEKFEEATLKSIRGMYKRLMEKYPWKDSELLFKFMFYTGQRMEHSLRALKLLQKDKSLIKFDGNIAYIIMDKVVVGHKHAFLAIMPRWFGEYLLKEIDNADFGAKTTYESRFKRTKVKATAIRTWFSTYLAEQGVPTEVINFLTGKVPESVLAKHYLDLRRLAIEHYKKLVEKWPEL